MAKEVLTQELRCIWVLTRCLVFLELHLSPPGKVGWLVTQGTLEWPCAAFSKTFWKEASWPVLDMQINKWECFLLGIDWIYIYFNLSVLWGLNIFFKHGIGIFELPILKMAKDILGLVSYCSKQEWADRWFLKTPGSMSLVVGVDITELMRRETRSSAVKLGEQSETLRFVTSKYCCRGVTAPMNRDCTRHSHSVGR